MALASEVAEIAELPPFDLSTMQSSAKAVVTLREFLMTEPLGPTKRARVVEVLDDARDVLLIQVAQMFNDLLQEASTQAQKDTLSKHDRSIRANADLLSPPMNAEQQASAERRAVEDTQRQEFRVLLPKMRRAAKRRLVQRLNMRPDPDLTGEELDRLIEKYLGRNPHKFDRVLSLLREATDT